MRRVGVLALGVLAACTTPAAGEPKIGDRAPKIGDRMPKIGERAPQIDAATWFNLPKGLKHLGMSDLRGQIILVEFWTTWSESCRTGIPHLIEMHDQYRDRGVVLVSLSAERTGPVSRYVKENKVPYIVGAGAKATERSYGIKDKDKDYPTMFIIDPDGNVAWSGLPSDEKVTKTIDALLKDNPPKAKAKLGDKAAKDALKKADALLKKKKYAEALKAYEKVAKDFTDSKSAKKARTAIEKLRADAKIMAQVRTDELKKECEDWLEMARSLAKSGDQKAAADYYDRIIDKYPDSKYAETAAEEKAKLKV